MKNYDYLIIGGGVAGTTAAEDIRKNDKKSSIAIISDEPYPFYSRIMLSKPQVFLEHVPLDSIFKKKIEWYTKNNVDLLLGKSATSLDPNKKEITLDDSSVISYNKLLLAVGTDARKLGLKNEDLNGIHCVRTLDDAKAIIAERKTTQHAVVVGGGFIGFEMCDILRQADIPVTLIIREKSFWGHLLGKKAGTILEAALKEHKITIIKKDEITEIHGTEHVEELITKQGNTLPCDMLIIGIGIQCPIKRLDPNNTLTCNHGIMVNEYLETEQKDIWAAGDCAEYKDVILGEQVLMGNWANSQLQGKVAAQNMLGNKTPFKAVTSYMCHAFGIPIAFIGEVRGGEGKEIIERELEDENGYAQLTLFENRIIGAALINQTHSLKPISTLIQNRVDISDKQKTLLSGDLKTLV